ncbi:uncharacterized protein LOC131217072 isoform X2 [Magnolia sinica]|uniref:uncharacterized protein LOC131217072 isoform X2 n=1 Tax=Magnolia sinica TaxID=86752 RepID=UPI00265A69E1|nr:uncharacterized protein LOC131217072 isoform X2 [Magnolia sinica]
MNLRNKWTVWINKYIMVGPTEDRSLGQWQSSQAKPASSQKTKPCPSPRKANRVPLYRSDSVSFLDSLPAASSRCPPSKFVGYWPSMLGPPEEPFQSLRRVPHMVEMSYCCLAGELQQFFVHRTWSHTL